MATPAADLDLPLVPFSQSHDRQERRAVMREIARLSPVARTDIGYAAVHHDTVTKVLRDRRWHSAAGLAAQLTGSVDPRLNRGRVSILSAEGDTHARLRRLVAPAFSPRSADRLRPFMRQVIDSLIGPACSCDRQSCRAR